MLTIEERNNLIIKNMSLADKISCNQFRRIPCVQLDEIKAAAYMGLVDAAIKWDGEKPFDVYAPFRIYGGIKDYLRSLLWGSRKNRVKVNSCQKSSLDVLCADNKFYGDSVHAPNQKPIR
jgi:DNA-directed RNA polymerase specialized sigma subunit